MKKSTPCNQKPSEIIDGHTTRQGDDIIEALKAAGYIIVRSDAIKLAQAHAREEV